MGTPQGPGPDQAWEQLGNEGAGADHTQGCPPTQAGNPRSRLGGNWDLKKYSTSFFLSTTTVPCSMASDLTVAEKQTQQPCTQPGLGVGRRTRLGGNCGAESQQCAGPMSPRLGVGSTTRKLVTQRRSINKETRLLHLRAAPGRKVTLGAEPRTGLEPEKRPQSGRLPLPGHTEPWLLDLGLRPPEREACAVSCPGCGLSQHLTWPAGEWTSACMEVREP